MARICLLTPGQPSVNPRIVKEADALAEAGHAVRVVCSHYVPWANDADRELLRHRKWKCEYVGGDFGTVAFNYTRVRFRLARDAQALWRVSRWLKESALGRTTAEMIAAARRERADLIIGHYTAGLLAAAAGAAKFGTRLGFDAEDFETGQGRLGDPPSAMDWLIEEVERAYLPKCDFVTAASQGIADAYREKYGIDQPTVVLNTFPVSERPPAFRPADPKAPLTLFWFSQTIGSDRGLEDVIAALGQLNDFAFELHLLGRWADGYREQLYRFAASHGIAAKRIVWHAPVASGELISTAAKYDVGLALEMKVSLNRDICVTNKLFTYMLAGNAIAASATRGQAGVMSAAPETGFTYPIGDSAALASQLRRWFEDRNALDTCRRAAWAWAESRFSWDVEKRQLLGLVDRVLSR